MSRLEEKLLRWVFLPDYLNISPALYRSAETSLLLCIIFVLPWLFALSSSSLGVLGHAILGLFVSLALFAFDFFFALPRQKWAGFLVPFSMGMLSLASLLFIRILPIFVKDLPEIEETYLLLAYLILIIGWFTFLRESILTTKWYSRTTFFDRIKVLRQEARTYTRTDMDEALPKYQQLLVTYVEVAIEGIVGALGFFYYSVLFMLLWIADKDLERALDCISHLLTIIDQREREAAEKEGEYILFPSTERSSLWACQQIQEAVLEALLRMFRNTQVDASWAVFFLMETVFTPTGALRLYWKLGKARWLRNRDTLLQICETYILLLKALGRAKIPSLEPEQTQWRKVVEFFGRALQRKAKRSEEDEWEEMLAKLDALQQLKYGTTIFVLYSTIACLTRSQSPLDPRELSKCINGLDVLRGETRLPLKNKFEVLEQLKQTTEHWTLCEQISSSVGRRSRYADVREELDKIRPLILTGPSGVLLGRIVEQWREEIDQRITMPAFVSGRGFNPYIVGDVIREPDMFFGRDEALAEVLDIIHNNHVAIYGERRIGKTSLLHQLDNRLREMKDLEYLFIPAFVSLQGVPAERLFYTLMGAIARSCQPRIGSLDLVWATNKEGYDDYDLADDLEVVLEALAATTDKQIRLVLLLDEGDELNGYDPIVQARLRRVLMSKVGQYLRMVWSGLSIDKEWKLDTSPWYNLFAIETHLALFTREEALSLIQEPVKGIYRYDKDAIELILRYSEYKPFHIQQICLATINRVLAQKQPRVTGPIRVTKEDVERAYRDLTAEEAISREVEERGRAGLLEKQVAEDRAEYQVNTDGQGDP